MRIYAIIVSFMIGHAIALPTRTSANLLMNAHAGGGVDGKRYTNSLEALNSNSAKGFRYFEIDFSWTSDKQLVCLHDREKSFKLNFVTKLKIR